MKIKQRLESFLQNRLSEGQSFDEFIIAPMGLEGRSLASDVIVAKPVKNQPEKTRIEIRREGLYDALPEGLFHEIVADETEDIQVNRKIEADARTFFLPYEQEFYRTRLQIEQFERALIDGHTSYFQANKYAKLWDISEVLTDEQQKRLLSILPFVPNIIGDLDLTQNCFELLLNKPVELIQLSPRSITLDGTYEAILGSTFLGKNSILGKTYYDGTPVLELVIKDIVGGELDNYLADGKEGVFINYAADFLLPYDVDFEVRCEVKKEMQDFVLAAKDSRLGYSSRL